MATDDARGWVLVIDAPCAANGAPDPLAERGATASVLGLSVVLRLALTAQVAGAQGIALGPRMTPELTTLLEDARLSLPIIDEIDMPGRLAFRSEVASVRAPANMVVHRATLAALALRAHDGEVSLVPLAAAADASRESERRQVPRDGWELARGTAGVYGFDPLLVTDDASVRVAQRALLRSLRKPQDGWTSTYLNRPISLALTRWLVATPLHPNQVSVGILGIGLSGAIVASWGTYWALVGGALLFHAQSVLDGCDGEMSRITFRGSRAGEWLDTIGDDLTNYGFFAGAAWGLYVTSGRALYLALGATVVLSGLIGSGLEYRYLIRIGSGDLLRYPLGIGKAPGSDGAPSRVSRALDAIAPLFKRDTFVFLTLLGAILGALGPFLAIFAVGALGVLTAVLRAELRMARDARKPAPPVDPLGPRD